jgi:hypothetical protein
MTELQNKNGKEGILQAASRGVEHYFQSEKQHLHVCFPTALIVRRLLQWDG